MNRLLDEKLKTNFQTKHIIKLQSLLTEYDRQNRFLNQQVRQLLQENKTLKIDKLKNSIVKGSRRRDSDSKIQGLNKSKEQQGKSRYIDNLEEQAMTEPDHLHKSREKLPPKNLYQQRMSSIEKTKDSKTKQNVKRDAYLDQDSNVQLFSFGEGSNSKEFTPRIATTQQKIVKPISIITGSPQKPQVSFKKQPNTTASKEINRNSPIIQKLENHPLPQKIYQQMKPIVARRTYTLQPQITNTYSISIPPKQEKLAQSTYQPKPNIRASSIDKRKKFISIVSSRGASSLPKQK